MKHEVEIEREYPHPPADVWAALTSGEALGEWLMETRGFVAEVGCRFELHCVEAGHRDVYRCEVLELQPPRRMLWVWASAGDSSVDLGVDPADDTGVDLGDELGDELGDDESRVTEVEFLLSATARGTRLTLRHRSDHDPRTLERFEEGWPEKLDRLGEVVAAAAAADQSKTEKGAGR